MRLDLKIVNKKIRNDDGYWIEAEVPKGIYLWSLTPKPGYAVVAASFTDDPRISGPMHLMSQPLPPAPYQFNASWLPSYDETQGEPK